MGSWFSSKRKKETKVSSHDLAVLQLKTQRDNIKKYRIRIESNLEKDRNLAKQLLTDGKRDRAKILLKKKRYQEQLLEKADTQLQNLEQLTQDLEFAQVEMKVVEGLKVGNIALKKLNNALNIEDIERILDETKEGVEKQKEIDELISGVLTDEDDELVENELANLISETNPVPVLPQVPDENIEATESKKHKTQEKARVALEAS